jgi:2,3-dihydroxyphenylpropionate 1,2-dioxygenase
VVLYDQPTSMLAQRGKTMSTILGPELLAISASHAPGMVANPDTSVGATFRAGLSRARDLVATFDPELVVMFGSDHRRAYEPIIPALSVVLSGKGRGDHGSPLGHYNIPTDQARALAQTLLNADFDVALSRDVRLDHGFGETFGFLMGSLDARPVLPVFINCATPPLARVSRAEELGAAVHDFLAGLALQRVLIVGSGGLSHSPPSLEVDTFGLSEEERKAIGQAGRAKAVEKINPDWDTTVLDWFARADSTALTSISPEFIEQGGVGANEIRTWVAAWAAAGGKPLRTLAYQSVPEWITGMGVVASAWILSDAAG